MSVLTTIFLILHLIGMAAILGGAIEQWFGRRAVSAVIVWAARIQLLTGLILAGLAYSGDSPPSAWWISVKVIVALAIVGVAESTRKRDTAPRALALIMALTTLNVIVAVAWH